MILVISRHSVTVVMPNEEKTQHKLGIVYPNGTTDMLSKIYFNTDSISAFNHSKHTFHENEFTYSIVNDSFVAIDGQNSQNARNRLPERRVDRLRHGQCAHTYLQRFGEEA